MEMILLILLTFVGIGSSLENMCLSYARNNSLQALSFCSDKSLVSSETIVLNAYKPAFSFGSTLCMCQLKVLSNLPTSEIYIKEKLKPLGDCGLALNLMNASGNIDTVTCNDYLDKEHSLLKDSSIVLTLTNTSVHMPGGFCFALSLRFEASQISVRCFNPGITTIPTVQTPALETTTSGYVTQTIKETASSITSATTSISTEMSTSQSSKVQYSTTTQSLKTSSAFTDLSTSSSLTQDSDLSTSTFTGNNQHITTTDETVSSTKTDSATHVTSKVRDKTEFNALYVIIPVLAVVLIGILCLVAIWYKRQYNAKTNLYRQKRLHNSVPSSVDTDHISTTKRYGDTLHPYSGTNDMREEPSFFYYEDQHIQKPVSDIYAKPMKKTEGNNKTGLYVSKHKNRELARMNTNRVDKKSTTAPPRPRDPNVVYVSVNGGERFVL